MKLFLALLFHLLISCVRTTPHSHIDQQGLNVQPDDCDNPDADIACCFVNMPEALTNVMTIASQDEPGERLIISGKIFKSDGVTSYPDVILYSYHTDHTGHYTKKGNERGFQKWHGHLHGWCKSDSNGLYEIHSIRPARYPQNLFPAHIHAAVKTTDGQMYFVNDFVFKDDSLVDDKYISSLSAPGGTGITDLKRDENNIWRGERDMVLR